jgi:hypothetical protein
MVWVVPIFLDLIQKQVLPRRAGWTACGARGLLAPSGQVGRILPDDAGLQFVFVVQDGLCKWNGIPAANKDVQIEIYLPGWEDYSNCQKCDNEAFRKISLSRDL